MRESISRVQGILMKPKEKKNGLNGVLVSLGIDEEWTLVVENDRGTLEDLCRILDSEGCKIDVSDTALDAISLLSRRTYVLVLMSGFLPDMSVLQFVRVVNSLAPDSVKIVILDEADVDVGDEALTVGADDVIFKPVVPDELLSLIEERLRKQRSDSEELLLTLGERCKVVACIPAYNEERLIASVLLRTMRYVDDVVVCDDGSVDITGDIAENLGAIVVRHDEKRGKGAALRTAFHRAMSLNPDVIVVLDADGQHNPEDIPRIIEPIVNQRCDVSIGSRFVEGAGHDCPFYRRFGLKVINTLMKWKLGGKVNDSLSGFRAFSSKTFEHILDTESEGFGVESEQLLLANHHDLNVMEVPTTVKYNGLERTSTKNPLSQSGEIIGLILRYVVEERPLALLGLPGFLIIFVGLIFGLQFLWYFNKARYFSLPMALITLGALLLGTMLVITALLLYALARWKAISIIRAKKV